MTKFTDNLWRDLAREHGATLVQAGRPVPGRARRPRVLAGSTLAVAGVGAALALVLTSTSSTPASAAVTVAKVSDGSILVTLNQPGSQAISQADAKLAAMGFHEGIVMAGLAAGPDVAFRWSLYLLLSLWPVSVYLAARAFGAGRPAAAASAAMAPFLMSVTGVGYEQGAYVWTGFGVWTQLWAAWTLPLAWGWSWRAIRDGRGYLPAVLLTALTVALHFETGYLALSVLIVWPFVSGRPLVVRLRRGAPLPAGSLLASAWVIVPLVAQRKWAAINEPLQGTGLVNGYGARTVLDWLFTGQLLDDGRLPVVTVL